MSNPGPSVIVKPLTRSLFGVTGGRNIATIFVLPKNNATRGKLNDLVNKGKALHNDGPQIGKEEGYFVMYDGSDAYNKELIKSYLLGEKRYEDVAGIIYPVTELTKGPNPAHYEAFKSVIEPNYGAMPITRRGGEDNIPVILITSIVNTLNTAQTTKETRSREDNMKVTNSSNVAQRPTIQPIARPAPGAQPTRPVQPVAQPTRPAPVQPTRPVQPVSSGQGSNVLEKYRDHPAYQTFRRTLEFINANKGVNFTETALAEGSTVRSVWNAFPVNLLNDKFANNLRVYSDNSMINDMLLYKKENGSTLISRALAFNNHLVVIKDGIFTDLNPSGSVNLSMVNNYVAPGAASTEVYKQMTKVYSPELHGGKPKSGFYFGRAETKNFKYSDLVSLNKSVNVVLEAVVEKLVKYDANGNIAGYDARGNPILSTTIRQCFNVNGMIMYYNRGSYYQYADSQDFNSRFGSQFDWNPQTLEFVKKTY